MNTKNWSDVDHIKNYINKKGYIPKTDLENLVHMIIAYYEGDLQDNGKEYYAIEDSRKPPYSLMINIEDLDAYIYDSGGLEEFDYYTWLLKIDTTINYIMQYKIIN